MTKPTTEGSTPGDASPRYHVERDRYHAALMAIRHVARDEYRDATSETSKRRWGHVLRYVDEATSGNPPAEPEKRR